MAYPSHVLGVLSPQGGICVSRGREPAVRDLFRSEPVLAGDTKRQFGDTKNQTEELEEHDLPDPQV